MNNVVKNIGDLAPLESFDPAAFRGDETASQDVCNFVLALALVYNDLKDLISAHVMLLSQKPGGSFRISRLWGDCTGIELHLMRLMVGLLHEIIELVKGSDKVLQDPFFQSIINLLRKEERNIWHSLVKVAQEKQTAVPEGRFAFFVRNKMVFHYDPKAIYWGYNTFFNSGTHGAERAFVSRGNEMATTRHYFADAASRGYFMKSIDGKGPEELMSKALETLCELNFALTDIVHHFIQKRGYPYKTETDET